MVEPGHAQGETAQRHATGLTAIELIIAFAVIAVIVTLALVYGFHRREQQRIRLQAAANAAPGRVFEVELRPERETCAPGEPIAFILEIHNPTSHFLDLTWHRWGLEFLGVYAPTEPSAIDVPHTVETRGLVGLAAIKGPFTSWERSELSRPLPQSDRILPGSRVQCRLEVAGEMRDVLEECESPGTVYAMLLYEPKPIAGAGANTGAGLTRFGTKVFEFEFDFRPVDTEGSK